MDLGVLLTDVTSFAESTLTGFGAIIAAFLAVGLVAKAISRIGKVR
jgi:hypothetical protein